MRTAIIFVSHGPEASFHRTSAHSHHRAGCLSMLAVSAPRCYTDGQEKIARSSWLPVLRRPARCSASPSNRMPSCKSMNIDSMSAASPSAAVKRIRSSQVSARVAESLQTVFIGMQRHRESVMHKPNINIHRQFGVFSSAFASVTSLTGRSTGHQRAAHVAAG